MRNVKKKLSNIVKKIKYKHILAILSLAFIVYIAWSEFPATLELVGDYLKNSRESNRASITSQLDKKYKNIMTFDADMPLNKGSYIDLNGAVSRVMGQRYLNERVKLHNGHLALLNEECDVTQPVETMTRLCDMQREKNKQFLLVIAPAQFSKYENLLPAGFDDFTNQNADRFADMLRENGVPVLDLRDELHNDGISHTEAFFVTDHHWTPQTGFWAYAKLIEYFAQSGVIGNIDSKYTDIDEFDIEVYKDWFLGSSGKRTGKYYAGTDDFEIINPVFATRGFSVDIPQRNVGKRGSFAEVAYDMSENRRDYFFASPYSAYGNNDNGLKSYRNSSAPVNLKVMSIGDSLSNVPFTFLPLVFSECDELDMRYYYGDFPEYYDGYDPDIIIVMIGAASPDQPNSTYDFFGD